jgi:hypothetical protein
MISRGEDSQNLVSTYITPKPTRSSLLKYRLRYAGKGIPTSPADLKRKKPKLKGWQEKATTDRRRIHMEANSTKPVYAEADGILTPTGSRYGPHGRWILDADVLKDLERLEKKLGVRLRDSTTEVRTQNGRLHLHFLWPGDEGPEIKNSVGKGVRDGFEGLDVRGEGGLAPLPDGSGRYAFANSLPTREAPPELVEWARGRSKGFSSDTPRGQRPRHREIAPGDLIPEGVRNVSLFALGLDLRYGGMDPKEVLEELEAINVERCGPPLDAGEVRNIARSVCRPEYRRRKRLSREALELVKVLEKMWWSTAWKKVGGKTEASIVRALLALAKRHGESIPAGMRVSISVRDLALIAGVSFVTVSRATKRLRQRGWVRKDDNDRSGPEAGAFILLDPRPTVNTLDNSPVQGESVESVNTTSRPPRRGPADAALPLARSRE